MDKWDLQFIRIYDFRLIPIRLYEQVKGLEMDLDRLFLMGNTLTRSPLTMLYALSDPTHAIRGVLWASLDMLTDRCYVNIYSVDPDYQTAEQSPLLQVKKFLVDELAKIKATDGFTFNKIFFDTSRPQVFEKAGLKKHDLTRMVYEIETQETGKTPETTEAPDG